MALAETLTYQEVVNWLVTGTVNYCQNTTTAKYNALPECIRKANWTKDYIRYQGIRKGRHGGLRDTCILTVTLTPGTSNIKSASESTVRSKVESYIKKVNSTLTANVTNDKIQGLFDAIICYCNDNIKIVSCACPAFDNINAIFYARYPVYYADSVGTVDFNTNILVEADDMIKSINNFSTFFRKYSHPKVISLQYTLSTHR